MNRPRPGRRCPGQPVPAAAAPALALATAPAPVPTRRRGGEGGWALPASMCLVALFGLMVAGVYDFTTASRRQTYRSANFARTKAAAEGYADLVYGRFCCWVNVHGGLTPGPQDVPAGGLLTDPPAGLTAPDGTGYRLVANAYTPRLVAVLPDDSEVSATNAPPSEPQPFPNAADASVPATYYDKVNKYYTITPDLTDKQKSVRTLTYKLVLTVAPTSPGVADAGAVTVVRYLQVNFANLFTYARFNNGSLQDGSSGRYYSGPLYAAYDMHLTGQLTVSGQVQYVHAFYGANNVPNDASNLTFPNGSGLRQASLTELIPNLPNILQKGSDGTRATAVEAGADDFSLREMIEVPRSPATDKSPIAQRRLYNRADVRIHVNGTTVTISQVNPVTFADQPLSPTSPLYQSLRQAITLRGDTDLLPFYDANLGVNVKTTDLDVGALKRVIEASDLAQDQTFPNHVIYVWDDTYAPGDAGRAGVRLYNGGELPQGGLVIGTDNVAYVKGDYNTGTQLATVNVAGQALPAVGGLNLNVGLTVPTTEPAANALPTGALATSDQLRRGDGVLAQSYYPQPAALFADAITELTQNWTDAGSHLPQVGRPTTYNLVEGIGTGQANERRSDDTFVDASKASIHWLENWNGGRRTTSGSEMQLYHSVWCQNLRSTPNNAIGWMDTSYNASVTSGLARLLHWTPFACSRGRYRYQGGVPQGPL